jgi:peptidoglycan/xylan/chitin deacetylase (PgdA/CDA1 family)
MLGSSAAILPLLDRSSLGGGDNRVVSITMDDPMPFQRPLLSPTERNQAILDALANHNDLKAALFVCGRNVDNPEGKRLLKLWDSNGHIIGNHSYSHYNLSSPDIDADTFERDILRCQKMIEAFTNFSRIFRFPRFPMLKEGETKEKRDRIRSFLVRNGYRTGHVTIDTSDWYIEQRMRERLEKDPEADPIPYRDYYIDHILKQAVFYNGLSEMTLGRSVKHTLLIHHNLLNALFLYDLLNALEEKGWKLVDAAEALTDPVFDMEPAVIPAGDSIIMALAREIGGMDEYIRYPGEDSRYEKERMDKLDL